MKYNTEQLQQLAASIQKQVIEIFPDCFFYCRVDNRFTPSIYGRFSIGKDSSEWSNGIQENDPALHTFHIFIEGEKLSLEWSQGNMLIKPENKILAYSRAKTGMRNKKGNDSEILKAVVSFFSKLPAKIKEQEDNICDQHKPLFKAKNLIN